MTVFYSQKWRYKTIQFLSGKKLRCVITEYGFCHLSFDSLSLIENCALAITGTIYIEEVEEFFHWSSVLEFCTVVIGTHVVGLILKFFYYKHKHPWMQLSRAYKCLGITSKTIIAILTVFILSAIPLIGYLLSPHSAAASTILYVLTALFTLLVFIITFWKYLHYY